jgi:uncharacterized protein with PQ loop repeat
MRSSMKITLTKIVGSAAILIGTSLMLPQIIKALTTKSMKDVALGMVILYVFNCSLWLIYGIRIKAREVTVANGIGLIISIVQAILKLKFG